MITLALAGSGGLGAVLRFVVDGLVRSRTHAALPLGTIAVNVTGSFALGLLVGAVLSGGTPESVLDLVGAGLLGGYTTFSTANLETLRLAQSGRLVLALVNLLGTAGVTVLVAGGGVALALALG